MNDTRLSVNSRVHLLQSLEGTGYLDVLDRVTSLIVRTFHAGNKLLLAGNGGSAADAQHFSAELVGRFLLERRGLPAIALTVDTSALTSISNDYSFQSVFARQVEALGVAGDVFIGFSTSGNSENVVNAAIKAKEQDISVIGFVGSGSTEAPGGKLARLADLALVVPSSTTALVQEVHEMSFHIICGALEEELFGDE